MKKIEWTPVLYAACMALAGWGMYSSWGRDNTFGFGLNAFSFGINMAFLIMYPLLNEQRKLIKSIMAGWKDSIDLLNEIASRAKKG